MSPSNTAGQPPSTEKLLSLIELIYASAMDAAKAPEALSMLNDCIDGSGAQTFTRDIRSGIVVDSTQSGIPEKTHREYISHWAAIDPRVALLASLPYGQVLRCHERFDADFVSSSAIHQDFLIPQGYRWAMGGMYDSGNGTATVVAGSRAADSRPFEEWAAAIMTKLLPHFRRAWMISSERHQENLAHKSASELLKRLPTPCLLTDKLGRCIEGNSAFHQSVKRLSLRLMLGRLRFVESQAQARWENALFETHATAVGRSINAFLADGTPWSIHLMPWHSLMPGTADVTDGKMILVLFEEQGAAGHASAAPALVNAKLTAAELEVLAALLQGHPAKVIASRRGASFNTVRNQIMAILDKTGHHSQRELIASFGGSVFPDSTQFGESR